MTGVTINLPDRQVLRAVAGGTTLSLTGRDVMADSICVYSDKPVAKAVHTALAGYL
jgi:hypothetical protein